MPTTASLSGCIKFSSISELCAIDIFIQSASSNRGRSGWPFYGFQWVQPVQLGFPQPPFSDPCLDFFLDFLRYRNIFIILIIFVFLMFFRVSDSFRVFQCFFPVISSFWYFLIIFLFLPYGNIFVFSSFDNIFILNIHFTF